MEPTRYETAGDQLCTDDLIDLRWEQRRSLRFVPERAVGSAVVHGGALEPGGVPDGSERQLAEQAVRGYASGELKHFAELLDARRRNVEKTLVSRMVENNYTRFFMHIGANPLQHLADEIHADTDESGEPITDDALNRLTGLATMLLWADVLADDGYTDATAEMIAKRRL